MWGATLQYVGFAYPPSTLTLGFSKGEYNYSTSGGAWFNYHGSTLNSYNTIIWQPISGSNSTDLELDAGSVKVSTYGFLTIYTGSYYIVDEALDPPLIDTIGCTIPPSGSCSWTTRWTQPFVTGGGQTWKYNFIYIANLTLKSIRALKH